MKRFVIVNTDYEGIIPKIKRMYPWYRGLKSGLCVLWKGKTLILIRPINERTQVYIIVTVGLYFYPQLHIDDQERKPKYESISMQ